MEPGPNAVPTMLSLRQPESLLGTALAGRVPGAYETVEVDEQAPASNRNTCPVSSHAATRP